MEGLVLFSTQAATASRSPHRRSEEPQGIYSFAGADPAGVFAEIVGRSPTVFALTRSFRSSPAVLRAVNAVAALRSAPPLRCADPTAWGADSTFTMQTFPDVNDEATAVVQHVQRLLETGATVGIIARGSGRLEALRRQIESASITFTDWSAPLHNVETPRRLRDHVAVAVRTTDDANGAIDALRQLCLDACAEDDVDTRDQVEEACAELREMVTSAVSLPEALARCRPDEPGEAPVSPGLHLLNAHLGKGQEFDHVILLGLEDGIVPDFRATTEEGLAEELRTLMVMVSRARMSLYVTCSATVPIASGWAKPRQPSRWWQTLLEAL